MANPQFKTTDAVSTWVFTADALPALPSSRYAAADERVMAGVRHERNGVPVAVYPIYSRRQWRLQLVNIVQASVASLQPFFDAKVFYYYPDSAVPGTYYLVEWVEDAFEPQLQGGGTYNLTVTLRQVP